MSTVNNYTAVALFVEDITSSPLSWEVSALAYAGNNLRTCLQMFHVLDIYVYSYWIAWSGKSQGKRTSFRTSYTRVEGPRLMQLPVGQLH